MTYFILKKVDIFYDKWLEVIYGVKDCYIQQQDYRILTRAIRYP